MKWDFPLLFLKGFSGLNGDFKFDIIIIILTFEDALRTGNPVSFSRNLGQDLP
jgi:hypothetical protein